MRVLMRVVLVAGVVGGLLWLALHFGLGPERASREARAEVGSAVRGAREALADLDVRAIAEELKETGRVVRRKAARAARQAAEATEDARTTAAITGKIAMDPELSVFAIDVNVTEGRVTLAGRVDSPEGVARAIRLALEEDAVHEVVSTLQVREAR